ncbi:tripartite tricarboxylate transporter substrate binding protein [Variovorax terrae]|uniref:Tripartite tricarboxylate transporter substrate binding protein n=1 Tax=Variovorax terrae TaxID=2923278 RepID=A0A9X1VTL8_9BURK|nr:tripartite tricarboxylate transporter substrate binding protein [Variovorax terrae]MCJ0762954.1 tripartite tricarboxylate transporter substrate binding protein [Variovorax terrae]
MQRRTACAALLAAASATMPLRSAHSQNRPLRIIVPFTAGGPTDVTTRLLADKARERLGTIIIDNKPGAGGGIGVEAVAKAAPDGLTLGIAAVAMHAINPWLFSRLPYDPVKDFAPITQMVRVPNVLVVNADTARRLRIATLRDFLTFARANPGRLNYASGGNGSAGHLAGEMFKQRAGFFAVHVPYNGGGPAQLALLAGQVDFTLDNLATAAPNIRAGRVVALGVTTAQRSPLLPEVPAIAETFPGFAIDTWWGLIAPAGTPPDVVQRLNAAFTAALNEPDTRSRFTQLMAEPVPSTPEQFAALIRSELLRYEAVVKASGAKVD